MNVVSFYRFLDLADPRAFRDDCSRSAIARDLLGTILVADEGFNGTLAGRIATRSVDGVRLDRGATAV